MGPYGPQPGPGPNPDWAPTRALAPPRDNSIADSEVSRFDLEPRTFGPAPNLCFLVDLLFIFWVVGFIVRFWG